MTLDDAAERLAQIAKGKVRPYSTFDFGREQDPEARSVIVSTKRERDVLEQFREELGPGFIAFLGTTRWLGDEFSFRKMPVNLAAFCDDVYEFCPDIVDQGTGSVEALREEIRDSQRVYLWWD